MVKLILLDNIDPIPSSLPFIFSSSFIPHSSLLWLCQLFFLHSFTLNISYTINNGWNKTKLWRFSINILHSLHSLSVCLFVCLFVSNKRQNGWTDRAQFFCGTSRDSREGLWIIKISNICLHQNSIFIKFLKILKIHEFFCENLRIIFVCFTMYTKRTCSQLI